MKTFISAEELKEMIGKGGAKVIDCRFDLFNPEYGAKAYMENHIEGAFFMDVNKDICGAAEKFGGARPVPDSEAFAKKLEKMGVGNSTRVVVYDDNIYGAARAFWQMKYIGMENVAILAGGFKEWVESGGECSSEIPKSEESGKITIRIDGSIYCDMDHVLKSKNAGGTAIIDGRAHERFTGEYEPLYAKAGHIPGALSFPCSANMDGECRLKDRELLSEIFKPLEGADEIISYCGSGIAGARNFVALTELGMPVRLYAGSLSDWISYDENDVETGE